ncbi:MAG: GumC family protein [Blastocatellia bacterium]
MEAEDDYKIRLRDYWQSIRKRLWLIIGVALLVTMLTAIYMARKPDVYQAQALAQVDLEEVNPALSGASKNNSVNVISQINDPAYFNTQLRTVTSPSLLRRVVKTVGLERNENFKEPNFVNRGSTWQNLRRMVGLGDQIPAKGPAREHLPLTTNVATATANTDLEEAQRYQPYVKEMLENLQVEPVVEKRMGYGRDNTRLIEIRYQHHDPWLAARIVNAIADVLVLTNLERKAEKSVSTGKFLQKRIAELQTQIRGGEERLLNYSKNNEILSLDASQNTVVERLIGLNRQLLEAENDRKLAESSYHAALAPGAANALAEENYSKQIADIKFRLADLSQRRAQLMVENTEEWPEVKEIGQQIRALEREIEQSHERSASVLLTNLKTRYNQARSREDALRADFAQQRGETLDQNEAAVNYRIIQQEIETNKNLLNGLLQNYKENDVALAGVHNNVHIIDYAVASDKPIGPKRLQGVALALFFALPLGVGLVLLLEYLNDTIRSVEDVEKKLRVVALAAIPTSKDQLETNGAGFLGATPLAESYRQLRTSVLLSTPGRAPRTLLVTSSLPAEGKTTSSINLAISLAQTKAKVLLIDADLRRPRLRAYFGLSSHLGLSSYLSREMSDAELMAMIQRHESSNLYLLTSGPVPPNPAELLGSDQMRRLIKTLEPHFTHIIIDSPPVGCFTDGVLVSSMVDGVLMVVCCSKTPREVSLRTRQMLSVSGANLLGVVLNQVNMSAPNYHYQRYYEQPNPATKIKVVSLGAGGGNGTTAADRIPGFSEEPPVQKPPGFSPQPDSGATIPPPPGTTTALGRIKPERIGSEQKKPSRSPFPRG